MATTFCKQKKALFDGTNTKEYTFSFFSLVANVVSLLLRLGLAQEDRIESNRIEDKDDDNDVDTYTFLIVRVCLCNRRLKCADLPWPCSFTYCSLFLSNPLSACHTQGDAGGNLSPRSALQMQCMHTS